MNRRILMMLSVLLICVLSVHQAMAVEVIITDGLKNEQLKKKMEQSLSTLLTEVNAAHEEGRNINFASLRLPSDVETTPGTEDTTPDAEEKTVAQSMVDAFAELAKVENATAESIANTLATNETLAFMTMAQKMEPGNLAGLKEEVKDFEDCYFVGPAIGSIPFVAYVFDLADDADANAFAANLESLHDLRWNICVTADQMLTAVEGDLVFFIMAPNAFEDAPAEDGEDVDTPVDGETDTPAEGGEEVPAEDGETVEGGADETPAESTEAPANN